MSEPATRKPGGEGETKIIIKRRVRIECQNCGDPATQRHTYLLENYRRNPKSAAYGKDDCTWCSDHDEFTCDHCNPPVIAGYAGGGSPGGTFQYGMQQLAHMFLQWREEAAPELLEALQAQGKADELAKDRTGNGYEAWQKAEDEAVALRLAALAKVAGAV